MRNQAKSQYVIDKAVVLSYDLDEIIRNHKDNLKIILKSLMRNLSYFNKNCQSFSFKAYLKQGRKKLHITINVSVGQDIFKLSLQ